MSNDLTVLFPQNSTIQNGIFKPVDASFPGGTCTAGVYWALPPLGRAPFYSGPQYDECIVKFIGERSGSLLKRMSWGLGFAWADLVVVGPANAAHGSAVDLLTKMKSDASGNPALYTISFPGGPSSVQGFSFVGMGNRCLETTIANGFIAWILPCVWQRVASTN